MSYGCDLYYAFVLIIYFFVLQRKNVYKERTYALLCICALNTDTVTDLFKVSETVVFKLCYQLYKVFPYIKTVNVFTVEVDYVAVGNAPPALGGDKMKFFAPLH